VAQQRKPKAFVIMPFSAEFDGVFAALISPALVSYDVERADTRLDQRGIIEKIVRGISEADLVVADLTGTNANVLYELGIAHTLRRSTVMIAQDISQLPFDIRAYPVQPYSTHFQRAPDLIGYLRQLGEAHAARLVEFASPVGDFLPDSVSPSVVMPQLGVAPEPSSYGIADFGEDMALANEQITLTASRLALQMSVLDTALGEITARVRETQAKPSANSAVQRKALATEAARAISTYSRESAEELPVLRAAWERYQRAAFWVARPEHWSQADDASRKEFVNVVGTMWKQMASSIGSSAEFKGSLFSISFISSDIAQSVEEAARSLDAMISEFLFAKSVLARILELVDEIPDAQENS
jgi:hypothetical protein